MKWLLITLVFLFFFCQEGKYQDLMKNGQAVLKAEKKFIFHMKPFLDKDKDEVREDIVKEIEQFNDQMDKLFEEYEMIRMKYKNEKLLSDGNVREISEELKKTNNALFDILGKLKIDYIKDREVLELIKKNDRIYNRKW